MAETLTAIEKMLKKRLITLRKSQLADQTTHDYLQQTADSCQEGGSKNLMGKYVAAELSTTNSHNKQLTAFKQGKQPKFVQQIAVKTHRAGNRWGVPKQCKRGVR